MLDATKTRGSYFYVGYKQDKKKQLECWIQPRQEEATCMLVTTKTRRGESYAMVHRSQEEVTRMLETNNVQCVAEKRSVPLVFGLNALDCNIDCNINDNFIQLRRASGNFSIPSCIGTIIICDF